MRPPRLAVPALVLLVAVAVRLATFPSVFGGERPRLLVDSDPHYHVLRAERWLAGDPAAPWRDPGLDWPNGADVPWPPLFDGLLALVARAAFGAAATLDDVAAAAAFVPVAFGVVLVLLVAALARRLLGAGGWLAAALVALLPVATDATKLGRPDQHAAELVLFVAILLAALAPLRPGGGWRRPAVALGLLGPLAFWTWMGSALHLVVPAATVGLWHLLAPERDPAARDGARALAAGGLGGAVLLSGSILVLGPPGALGSGRITGVDGLHAALLAAVGGFGALLSAASALRRGRPAAPPRRAGEVALAAALPLAALALVPALRAGIAGGLTALGASSAWYGQIDEFHPIVFLGSRPLRDELVAVLRAFGLAPVAALVALPALRRAWREEPGRRPALLTLAVSLALFVPATVLRKRLAPYAIVPLAVAAEGGLRWIAARAAASRPALRGGVAGAALLACIAPGLPELLAQERVLLPEEEDLLSWIATVPIRPGHEAVLAPWSYGHLVRYLGDRPVVASPFGPEAGARSLEDVAAFWFATTGADAESALDRRRAGLVLLASVAQETMNAQPLAPPGTPRATVVLHDVWKGRQIEATPAFWRLVANRLYFRDGAASEGGPPLDGLRLLAETPSTAPGDEYRERRWMLFERVPGARVRVQAGPGVVVRAGTTIVTNTGRSFEWATAVRADGDGVAALRLPYASGANGAAHAAPWTVSAGAASATLVLHEDEVLDGRGRDVALGAAAPASPRRGGRERARE